MGQTGLDVIVCAAREDTGRAGEVPAIGVFCHRVGEFTGGRERVQAGGDASTETRMSRDVSRARLRGHAVSEFAVSGPHLSGGTHKRLVEVV